MPPRERSFAQEIEERVAAGDFADEDAARSAVVDDLATRRLDYRCLFEEGDLVAVKLFEFKLEFRPVRKEPDYAWNLWQQIRASAINGEPVKFSPDNKTITAGKHRIVDIVLWNRDETTVVPAPPPPSPPPPSGSSISETPVRAHRSHTGRPVVRGSSPAFARVVVVVGRSGPEGGPKASPEAMYAVGGVPPAAPRERKPRNAYAHLHAKPAGKSRAALKDDLDDEIPY
jgi:hypothetical protein